MGHLGHLINVHQLRAIAFRFKPLSDGIGLKGVEQEAGDALLGEYIMKHGLYISNQIDGRFPYLVSP